MYIPSAYSSVHPHSQILGILGPSSIRLPASNNGISTNLGFDPATVTRRAWTAISSIWASGDSSADDTHELKKRGNPQSTNVTIAVLVAIFVTLFFALLFWFLYRYRYSVRFKSSKKRHRHGRRRSGGSRSSKSMHSGGPDSAPPSPEAGPAEPPPPE